MSVSERGRLEAEIRLAAPGVSIDWIGRLTGDGLIEAIVRDPWGQYLWSHYRELHGISVGAELRDLDGQLAWF